MIRRAIRAYQLERRADRHFALVGVAEGPGGSVADLSSLELVGGFGE